MSESPIDEAQPSSAMDIRDQLLAVLRQVPSLAVPGSAETRLHRQVRASYVRSFESSARHSSALGLVQSVAVLLFHAGTVGVYMTWAIAAATTLIR